MVNKLIKLALAQQKDGCSRQLSVQHSASQQPSDVSAVRNRATQAEPEEVETPLLGGLNTGESSIQHEQKGGCTCNTHPSCLGGILGNLKQKDRALYFYIVCYH